MLYNIVANVIANIVSFIIYNSGIFVVIGLVLGLTLIVVLILMEVNAMYEKDYKSVKKFIKKKLKNAKELKVLTFMGKDLVEEEGFLYDIKKFLEQAREAIFLIEDPNSNHVDQRANTLNRPLNDIQVGINNTINQISHEFQQHFQSKVKLKKCNFLPIFKLYFIDDILIIGFYTKQKSYQNSFLIVNSKSGLYDAMRKYYDNVEKKCK